MTRGEELEQRYAEAMTRALWFKILVVVLLTLGLVAKAAWTGAYSTGYEPYPNARKFPLRTCSLKHNSAKAQEYLCSSKNSLSSILVFRSGDLVQLEVVRNKSLKARVKLNYVNWLDYALEGDLNHDGLPDYVMVEPSGGNGLASEYCLAIFVLSSKTGYVVTKLNTMGFDPNDLLELERGQTNVVHTWFVNAEEPTSDGKYHNYWVYHFLKVHGTKLVFDGKQKPVWIQYKLKQNHRPTRLVSSSQKTRWWNTQKQLFFWR